MSEELNKDLDEPTGDNTAPDKKPENDTLFKLGCLGVVIVFIVCVVKICEVFLGSFLDFTGLGKWVKSSQEEKKQLEQTQEAASRWLEANLPDAELIGTPERCTFLVNFKTYTGEAIKGTMRRNGREFSYVYEPARGEMYSDEYADAFDRELDRCLHSRLLYTVMGEGLHYTVMSKTYEYMIAENYEGKRNKKTSTSRLMAKSMHPAFIQENQIGEWIDNSYPTRFRVTEQLTLEGCKDITELTVITEEEQAGIKGINLRVFAALCEGSEITIYSENGTSYILLEKKGSPVTVTYRTVDPWTDPHKESWYSTRTETYRIN